MKTDITRRDFIGAVSAASITAASVFAEDTKSLQAPRTAVVKKSGADAVNRQMCFQFTFGLKDEVSTKWDGSIEVLSDGARIIKAALVDHFPDAAKAKFEIDGGRLSWQGGSRREPNPDWVKGNNRKLAGYIPEIHDYAPLRMYTFIVTVSADENDEISVDTANGSFTFTAADVPMGRSGKFLGGQVLVAAAIASNDIMPLDNSGLPTRYNDFPSICTTSDGATHTAFVSFLGGTTPLLKSGRTPAAKSDLNDFSLLNDALGGDQIFVVREYAGQVFEPQAITEPGQDIYGVQITADINDDLWAVWSQKSGGSWDLYLRSQQGGVWGEAKRLTSGAYPDIHPAIAADAKGNVHICLQGFREKDRGEVRSDILYIKIDGRTKAISPETVVSKTGGNNWEPAIAVSDAGKVAVVWDTYQKGDYDVYYSMLEADGNFGESVPVAASRKFEARASAVFDKDEMLWIAYEEADENWGKDKGDESNVTKKGVNIHMGRTINLKCFKDGSVYEPPVLPSKAIEKESSYSFYYKKFQNPVEYATYTSPNHYLFFPVLVRDARGGINLIYKKQFLNSAIIDYAVVFANYLIRFGGDGWSEPVYLADSDGQSYQKPSATAWKDGVAVASASDKGASTVWSELYLDNNIRLSTAVIGGEVSDYRMYLADEAAVDSAKRAIVQEKEDVDFIRDYRAKVGGKSLQIFRGDTHRHTTFSSDGGCDGSIIDCMRYSLDAAALDWVSNGDHDNGNGREYTWYITQKFYDVFKINERFLPMFGYERSNGYPKGHRNVVTANRGFRVVPRQGGAGEDTLYSFCKENDAIAIAHTSGTSAAGTDWSFNDPVAEPVVEIYQGARNSYEYPGAPRAAAGDSKNTGFYWEALRKGLKLGVIASSDHKSTHCSYAMVYMENPTRMGMIEALRKRHCYAATDNILLEVKMGDYMMGDIFTTNLPVKLRIYARGTGDIKQIDIIKNCQVVDTLIAGKKEHRIIWTDNTGDNQDCNHYYVRVMQADGELAWSSPMWVSFSG